MVLAPTPSQSLVYRGLGDFFTSILPAGVEIAQAQENRVPEPKVDDYVLMNAVLQRRLSTNVDAYEDVELEGSISGATLTVASVAHGSLAVGQAVFGASVAAGTVVVALGTGSGGPGTYTVSPGGQTVALESLAAGAESITEPTEYTIQIDVHGPNSTANAQVISTLFRDARAVDFLKPYGVAPFYADDPRQTPFVNAEKQYETRWVINAVMQIDSVVGGLPQQFAAELEANIINVEATYPA